MPPSTVGPEAAKTVQTALRRIRAERFWSLLVVVVFSLQLLFPADGRDPLVTLMYAVGVLFCGMLFFNPMVSGDTIRAVRALGHLHSEESLEMLIRACGVPVLRDDAAAAIRRLCFPEGDQG